MVQSVINNFNAGDGGELNEKYWLYVVLDYTINPRLYRVQDPAFKVDVLSRKSFSVSIGDVIRAAESD